MTAAGTARLRVRTVELPDLGDLLGHLPDPDGVAWVRRGDGVVGWGEALRLDLGTPAPIGRAAASWRAVAAAAAVEDPVGVPGTGLVAFLSATFDPEVQGSALVVPRVVLGRRGGRCWVTTVADGADPPAPPDLRHVRATPAPSRIRYAGAQVDELRWLEAVAGATKRIAAGDLDKVVLARDLAVWSTEPLDPRTLLRRLADRFPDCFAFAVDGLVGATPELLVRRHGSAVDSVVLAGTAARSEDDAADAAMGRALLDSDKDRDEHVHAVASVRDALAGVTGDLEVDGPTLLRLDNVQHLATAVRGRLSGADADGTSPSVLDLADRLHPTAAVCGTPTADALALIREIEGLDRGRYTGPVGWVDGDGDGELGIALRCAQVDGDRATLYAGAGVVAASLPEAELEETRMKFLAFQAALGS